MKDHTPAPGGRIMDFDPDLGLAPAKLLQLQRAMVDTSEPLAIALEAGVVDLLFALLANAADLLQGSPPEVRAVLADRALTFIHRNCGATHADIVAAQIQRVLERGGGFSLIKPAGNA